MASLSDTWAIIKDNPWKIFLGTSGTVIFTVVGILFSDSRYVHKTTYEKEQASVQASIAHLQQQIDEISKRDQK